MKKMLKTLTAAERDPRYILLLLGGLLLFIPTYISSLNVHELTHFESVIFNSLNNLPGFFFVFFYVVTQFGAFASVLIWVVWSYFLSGKYLAIKSTLSIVTAYLAAKFFKISVARGRPSAFFEELNIFDLEKFSGFGFPSGHAAVSSAVILTMLFYFRPKVRKYIILLGILIGISRIYLGGHLPWDVLGGWGIGALSASIVSLALGTMAKAVDTSLITNALKKHGHRVKSVKLMSVDARGSVPIIINTVKAKFVGKLYGEKEHAASWLFRTVRFFRFKSFEDEEPYLTTRRQLEHEALLGIMARKIGVRAPEPGDIFAVGEHWLLLQDYIDGTTLGSLDSSKITSSMLSDVWGNIFKLHKGFIAHGDLRAENIFIDDKGKAWILDFGFSRLDATERRLYIDLAEALTSIALKVGVGRAVKSLNKYATEEDRLGILRYLQLAALSGETTSQVKNRGSFLQNLRSELGKSLQYSDEPEPEEIQRLTRKKALNGGLLLLFLIIGVPQLRQFWDGLTSLQDINIPYTLLALMSAVLTYVFTATSLMSLSSSPLKFIPTMAQSFASSYVGRFLPKGAGSATVAFQFLKNNGFSSRGALSLTLINRLIGVITFVVPAIIFVLVRGTAISDVISFNIKTWQIFAGVGILAAIIITLLNSRSTRRSFKEYATRIKSDFVQILSTKRELGLSILASLGVSFSFVACLYFSMLATSASSSLLIAVISFATASIAASAAPTPGGLGATEITMVAVMTSFSIVNSAAFAAVILFRLLTFWLPVPIGFVSFKYLQKNKLL